MKRNFKLSATLLVLIVSTTQAMAAGEVMHEALKSFMFWAFILAVMLLVVAIYALNKSLNTIKWMLTAKQEVVQEDGKVVTQKVQETSGSFMQALTDAVPIKNEEDILMDHNYDGIMELDNNLPPWWKYGFYLTIIWAVGYFLVYEVMGSKPNQAEEFKIEMAEAQEEVDAYIAANGGEVDENNVEYLSGEQDLTAGKEIFSTICFVCHAADGGGNAIGPNLTDDYWINGDGTIEGIFKVVKHGGREGRGMQAWSSDLSAEKMQQVSSYILSLKGSTTAAPKDAEGEYYP